MTSIARVPGDDNLFVGGIWVLNLEETRAKTFEKNNITHILSVILFSFDAWGEEAKRYKHLSIDIDDDESSDLLVRFPAAVRFIESGLRPQESESGNGNGNENDEKRGGGGVYVHCAMGKSRSVSCVIAYLLYKCPHRFGGGNFSVAAAQSAQRRRDTAKEAVHNALTSVRETRPGAEPNPGFMRQLELWWEMGCPADDDGAVERHPVYQKWLYDGMLQEARDMRMAPDAERIRFEDEVEEEEGTTAAAATTANKQKEGKEVRCKKCRRTLATPNFLVPHTPLREKEQEKENETADQGQAKTTKDSANTCAHIFIDTLSWMRPVLEEGTLDGRLICPNAKCGATVGRFAWQGFQCTCKEWVVPAFSLNRSRVDEVSARQAAASGIRMPPGRNGSL
ncbi:protein-tyrosine phosphatase-like protein [Astrocystis sublimbata]|nr:protein-tyrosine phosphatase-like protein [Astrocystis sublimbata]